MNMDPTTNRGTSRDQAVIDGLLDQTEWSNLRLINSYKTKSPLPMGEIPKCSNLFDWLRNAKFDSEFWNEMSTTDCLRIDYKGFQNSIVFGISSILVPLFQLQTKVGFVQEMQRYTKDVNIQLLVVMSLSLDENGQNPKRELMIASPNELTADAMSEFFLDANSEASKLQLKVMEGGCNMNLGDGFTIRSFLQENVEASRKQVAPVMLQCKL